MGLSDHFEFYKLPRRFLYLTKTAMDFWDILYFWRHLMAERGQSLLIFKAEDFARLYNGSLPNERGFSNARRRFGEKWKRAVADNQLIMEEAKPPDWYYRLRIPGYESMGESEYILKPLGYVENGWLRILKLSREKKVLNFLLTEPRDRRYKMDECIKEFKERVKEQTGKTSNTTYIRKSIHSLIRYGILKEEGDLFRLDLDVFNVRAVPPAPSVGIKEDTLASFRLKNPAQAEKAEKVMRAGGFSEEKFEEIFHDIGRYKFTREDRFKVLLGKVYYYREKNIPSKWRTVLSSARSELARRKRRLRSNKTNLRFHRERKQFFTFLFDRNVAEYSVGRAKLVCNLISPSWKVNQPVEEMEVQIELLDAKGNLLISKTFHSSSTNRSEFHNLDITPQFKRLESYDFLTLMAETASECNWLRLKAYLELVNLRPV